METLLTTLRQKRVLLSDGGWGSMLLASGLTLGEAPERWNLERPEAVADVARAYVEAGADCITSNTFGGNRFRLALAGLDAQVDELNAAGARLSWEAAGESVHVCASMGPTGLFLMEGTVTEVDLYEAYAVQARALEAGGANVLLVETMADTEEAACAVRAARDSTTCEVICTFTFNRSPHGAYHTMMGVTPEAMVEAMLEAGAHVIGANCTLGPADMVDLVGALHAAAPDTPILVQANAGQPERVPGGVTYPETPESFAQHVPALITAGAGIIGGCCGTRPEHIRAMRDAIDRHLAGKTG